MWEKDLVYVSKVQSPFPPGGEALLSEAGICETVRTGYIGSHVVC